MLSREDNDRLTQTGPDTPCGGLMRAYWQPAALVSELRDERPVDARAAARRGPRPVPQARRRLRPHRPLLRPPRRRPRVRAPRGRRPALPLPRLALRPRRALPRAARRARAQPLPREDPPRQLPVPRAQRHRVRLHRRRRSPAVPRLRLLRRARRVHVRVQGALGVQLAPGRRGRHRPQPRLVPAPLHQRGPARDVRPAVRRAGRGHRHHALRAGRGELRGRTSRSRRRTTGCASSRSASSTRRPGTSGSRTSCSPTPSSSRSGTRRCSPSGTSPSTTRTTTGT